MPVPEEMRVAVFRGRGQLAVEARPVPKPGSSEVLLRVSHCGVCGTDLHLVMDGWARKGTVGGHEYSGSVAAVGSGVSGWVVGDAAVGGPLPSCGSCGPCLAQRPSLCTLGSTPGANAAPGAFAEYVLVNEGQLLRVPSGVSLRESALCEPLAVALHGITLSGVAPGQRVLITGVGPIGMLTLAALKARGVEDVAVSEPSAVRRELAGRIGATRLLAPEDLELLPMPFSIPDDAVDVVFECSGRAVALQSALGQLGKGGVLVILGTGMERPQLDTNRVLLNELVVTGAYNYDEGGFAAALELLASGRLPLDLLIEAADVPLEGMVEAMRGLAAGHIGGKVLVAPGGSSR